MQERIIGLMEKMYTELTGLKDQMATKDDIAKLETSIDNIDTRIDSMETKIENIDTRIDGIESKIENIDTRMDNMESKIEIIDTRIDGIENNMVKIETKIENEVIDKLRSLFDFREVQVEMNNKMQSTLERIENKIDVLQMETAHVRRIK